MQYKIHTQEAESESGNKSIVKIHHEDVFDEVYYIHIWADYQGFFDDIIMEHIDKDQFDKAYVDCSKRPHETLKSVFGEYDY